MRSIDPFVYDDQGHLWKVLNPDDGSLLLQFFYRPGEDAPVSYQMNGMMYYLTADDHNWVAKFASKLYPGMSDDEFNAAMAELNAIWSQPPPGPGSDRYTRNIIGSIPGIGWTVPKTYAQCVTQCRERFAAAGAIGCGLLRIIRPGWGGPCVVAMAAAEQACEQLCPPESPPYPAEYVWCLDPGSHSLGMDRGAPVMGIAGYHPEYCGDNPVTLLGADCSGALPAGSLAPGPWRKLNGDFTVAMRCIFLPNGELVPTEISATMWVICGESGHVSTMAWYWNTGTLDKVCKEF